MKVRIAVVPRPTHNSLVRWNVIGHCVDLYDLEAFFPETQYRSSRMPMRDGKDYGWRETMALRFQMFSQ